MKNNLMLSDHMGLFRENQNGFNSRLRDTLNSEFALVYFQIDDSIAALEVRLFDQIFRVLDQKIADLERLINQHGDSSSMTTPSDSSTLS